MIRKKLIKIILILILLGDFTIAFFQYYTTPIMGDIAGGVVPVPDVQAILNDPFGLKILNGESMHPNPNRYFAHLFFRDYFREVPILLQRLVSPVESVYWANALIKMTIHALLVYLLATLVANTRRVDRKLLTAAVLITPLFQTNGYQGMTIINGSITYAFFYIIPIFLLIAFLAPFYPIVYTKEKEKLSFWMRNLLVPGLLVLPLSGPLVPGISLIVILLLLGYYFRENYILGTKLTPKNIINTVKSIPFDIKFFFIPLGLISFYSLWLGTYAAPFQTNNEIPPILERYSRLPKGLFELIFTKVGFPTILGMISYNLWTIQNKYHSKAGQQIIKSAKWFLAFAALYILILPLGGYRPYRPNIIRHDTFMPITIGLLYLFGVSTVFLLDKLKDKTRYKLVLIVFLLQFVLVDRPVKPQNIGEKQSLIKIANSKDSIVALDCNCKVISWHIIKNPEESKLNAELLQLWKITEQETLYYDKN